MRTVTMITLVAAALAAASCDVFIPDLGGEGEPCSGFGDCYGDLVCVFGICGLTPGLGDACEEHGGTLDEACEEGAWCIDGQCVEAGGVGQPCLPEELFDCTEACVEGTYCVSGTCVALGGEGEPCLCADPQDCIFDCDEIYTEDAIAACDDGLHCVDWACAGPSPEYVVQPDSDQRWTRCPRGMTWSGWHCTGAASNLTWNSAAASCPAGYSLPLIDDFIAILGACNDNALEHYSPGASCASCSESETCSSMFTNDLTNNDVDFEYADLYFGEYWTIDGMNTVVGYTPYAAVDFFNGIIWGTDSGERLALCISQ